MSTLSLKGASLLLALVSGFALMPGSALAAEEAVFYIGTYTRNGDSKGIYRATLNTDSGALSQPVLAAETEGPSFLAFHPDGKHLYAVHEPTAGASAFAIEADGTLRLLGSEPSQGAGPCHVSVDPQGKNLFVACYSGGSLASLPIKSDGSLSPASFVFRNEGSGPNKSRQEKPHLHAIYSDADGRFVYACDLGTDEVLIFKHDAEKGKLTPASPAASKVPPGGGPRHLALHPGGKFAFVNNEMGNSVSAFARDESTGGLTLLQTISTMPEDASQEGVTTSEIFCDPTGKFLYVSNRGHDSIAAYAIGETGKLTLIEIQPAGVETPRGFGIDPSGRWLVVAGQKSNDLTALRIDPATGKLEPGPNRIEVGSPVCVVFAE